MLKNQKGLLLIAAKILYGFLAAIYAVFCQTSCRAGLHVSSSSIVTVFMDRVLEEEEDEEEQDADDDASSFLLSSGTLDLGSRILP